MREFLVFLSGLAAGFVNVVSAGGSFITIPLLVFAGLAVDVANGTNRLAVLLQNVVASWKFKKAGVLEFKRAIAIAAPMVFGSILGANVAVAMDRELLKRIVGILLMFMALFVAFKGKFLERTRKVRVNRFLALIVLFAVGVYGGFIQAGVGFFIILSLASLEGMNVVEGNAYKVFSILVYTSISIWIFIMGRDFNLEYALILSAGNMTGAYFGTKAALEKGAAWLRAILVSMMLVSAVLFITGF